MITNDDIVIGQTYGFDIEIQLLGRDLYVEGKVLDKVTISNEVFILYKENFSNSEKAFELKKLKRLVGPFHEME